MDTADRFFDSACRLLAVRDYFTEELRQKILAKGATAEETEAVIKKLSRFNYLNDTKVLEKYVAEIISKGKGINYLKRKLFEKGCSSLLSSCDLAAFYPFEEECAAAERTLARLGEYEEEKLVSKLVSRGFSIPAALNAVKKRKG